MRKGHKETDGTAETFAAFIRRLPLAVALCSTGRSAPSELLFESPGKIRERRYFFSTIPASETRTREHQRHRLAAVRAIPARR